MLVSAIMPTADRRQLLPLAVRSFLSQDWPEKELIVIDDGDDPIRDLLGEIKPLVYGYSDVKRTIGAKLNAACELAAGEILIRWDDDDWSAPGRMTEQVNRLVESGKSISGYHSMLFWSLEELQMRRYRGSADYALGTSICCTREYWERNPFADLSKDEDNMFIRRARKAKDIGSVDAGHHMVALTHRGNTYPRIGPSSWPVVGRGDCPKEFFEALG